MLSKKIITCTIDRDNVNINKHPSFYVQMPMSSIVSIFQESSLKKVESQMSDFTSANVKSVSMQYDTPRT